VALYLVERYVPSMTLADLAAAVTRIGELPSDDVRHLWTILVAAEDTCLSVFEGPDAEAVEEANLRARFHLDRVVEVTSVEIGQTAGGEAQGAGPGRRKVR
jgi:hypothetical protein